MERRKGSNPKTRASPKARRNETRQHFQKGRVTCAVRADESTKRSWLEREADILYGFVNDDLRFQEQGQMRPSTPSSFFYGLERA